MRAEEYIARVLPFLNQTFTNHVSHVRLLTPHLWLNQIFTQHRPLEGETEDTPAAMVGQWHANNMAMNVIASIQQQQAASTYVYIYI